jgi:hypothetical protein
MLPAFESLSPSLATLRSGSGNPIQQEPVRFLILSQHDGKLKDASRSNLAY